jgi:manganese/zinc/iron transport system permease protein
LGIVGGFLVNKRLDGVSLIIGAVVVGLITAFLAQVLSGKGIQADAAIGIVFTFLFAIGVILLSLFAGDMHLDVDHTLMEEITYIHWDTIEWNGFMLGLFLVVAMVIVPASTAYLLTDKLFNMLLISAG